MTLSDDQEPSAGDRLATRASVAAGVSVAAGTAASLLAAAAPLHAAGGDVLRVGLIGCGGRGTGAAAQALRADAGARLTAMGDAFADRLEESLGHLCADDQIAARIDVPAERRFVGFDAYQGVIANSDVVLLATPPYFRPRHLAAAVEAGRHVFAEKPVAVDAPGVRRVLETCRAAAEKKLSVVSGLCLRYSHAFRQTIARVHDGAIGDVVALVANDLRGPIWVKPRQADWDDMLWQMRNWYYFTWLSGDFNVEQHVHFLDVCAWIMKEQYPRQATGMGGRAVRTGPEFGNIFDHHAVSYEYDSGVLLSAYCRQQAGCAGNMSVEVIGTSGSAYLSSRRQSTSGRTPWRFEGEDNDIYQAEHDDLFSAIRQGRVINHGEYMAKSTLLAILGRAATYSGQVAAWDPIFASNERLGPEKLEWGPAPEPTIAVPGTTPLALP